MSTLSAYLLRIALMFSACTALLWFTYHVGGPYDHTPLSSYLEVSSILTACGLCAWLVRPRASRTAGSLVSLLVAAGICFSLVWYTLHTKPIVHAPWHDFYQDDLAVRFIFFVPLTVGFLAAILSLIPESRQP